LAMTQRQASDRNRTPYVENHQEKSFVNVNWNSLGRL